MHASTRFPLITRLLLAMVLTILVASCVGSDPSASPSAVVEHAWELVDTRYALFPDKNVDWDSARQRALSSVASADVTDEELFEILTAMLDELEDGHINVVSPFNVSWTPAFFEEGVPYYDADLVHRHVLGFEFQRIGPLEYARLDGWSYLRVADFESLPPSSTLDQIFETLGDDSPMILDLRSNGGGELELAARLLARFIDEEIVGWQVQTSTGPGHGSLSEPRARKISPADGIRYDGALAVLIDGRTYSAANLVAFDLAERPRTILVGSHTGGGGGSTSWFELPNGWAMRIPTRRLTTSDGRATEPGIAPEVEVTLDATLAAEGRDAIIEAALESLARL